MRQARVRRQPRLACRHDVRPNHDRIAVQPKVILDNLSAALEVALKDQTIIARFAELASPMYPKGRRGAPEAKAMLKSEVAKWAKLIKSAGISASH